MACKVWHARAGFARLEVCALPPSSSSDSPSRPPSPVRRRCPERPAVRSFPRLIPGISVSTSCPWRKRSAAIVATIGADTGLHADFGSGLWRGQPIGIPITVVPGTQAKTRVTFDYADESDRGPYPIPANVRIEGGSDRHALIVDRDRCRLYELYALERRAADAGMQGPERSGAFARTGCDRPAGRLRTPPAYRSCPAWLATTRSREAASITRCASRSNGRGGRTSIRPGTTPATRPIRRCRRWACVCG